MKMRTWMCALPLIFNSFLGSIVANAYENCACPANDPIAKKSCGTTPAKINPFIFFETNACFSSPDVFNTSESMINSAIGDLYSVTNLKSKKEVLNYMSCYAERGYNPDPLNRTRAKESPVNLFCHYKTTLVPNIALAAESAGLSFAVQSCLYFKETQFISEAKSPKGATGYIQFMPDCIKKMNIVVGSTEESFEKSILEFKNKLLEEEKKLKSAKVKKEKLLLQKNINYFQGMIINNKAELAAKKVWSKYWEGTENPPHSINGKSVKCPQLAFALSVAKQTYDLNLLSGQNPDEIKVTKNNDHSISINKMDELDSEIFLAGSYNGGVAGLAKKCAEVKSLDECFKKYNKNSETLNYMKSIRSCAERGSDKPMANFEKRNCGGFRCN